MDRPVLLVTGKLAAPLVRKFSAESDVKTEIRIMPVSVATFISSELLVNELKGLDPSVYSMLLVPGLARCDLKEVEDALGLPTFKGSKYAADIPLVLNNLHQLRLSKEEPADEILKSKIQASVREALKRAEAVLRPSQLLRWGRGVRGCGGERLSGQGDC
jgi:hypothetical protein